MREDNATTPEYEETNGEGRQAVLTVGKPEEMADIIDFGNFVFSMAHRPHDFGELLPKCYGEGRDTSAWHYLMKEGSRIQAMVMAMPQTAATPVFYPELQPFLRTGIGTVSVHHRARSKGYMRELMHRAIRDMAEQGSAYSFLGGQRQRYRYYGYEMAGLAFSFNLSLRNLTMTWPELKKLAPGDSLRLMELPSAGPLLDEAYELYEKTACLNVRPKEDFTLICRNFNQKAWAVVDTRVKPEPKLLCWFVGNAAEGSIAEITRAEAAPGWPELLVRIMNLMKKDHLSLQLKMADGGDLLELQNVLLHAAEGMSLHTSGMILILDFAKTLMMLLTDKASRTRLPSGELTLIVTDCPEHTPEMQTVTVRIAGGYLSVRGDSGWSAETALAGRLEEDGVPDDIPAAAIQLSYLDVISWLFSPRALLENPVKKLPRPISSWFPLNPHIEVADNC